MKQKFNPELASEMEWSECVLAASIKQADDEDYTVWFCADCTAEVHIKNHEHLTETAQAFIDAGWRYRRTREGIDALCDKCRSSHKK